MHSVRTVHTNDSIKDRDAHCDDAHPVRVKLGKHLSRGAIVLNALLPSEVEQLAHTQKENSQPHQNHQNADGQVWQAEAATAEKKYNP